MKPRLGILLTLLALLAAILVTAAAPAKKHGGAQVTIKPHKGSPTTKFVVSFTAPDSTSNSGSISRRYVVSAAMKSSPSGCVSRAIVNVTSATAHQRVHVTLDPSKLGGKWCLGHFDGSVEEIVGPNCQPPKLCPLFVSQLKTLGKFSFRVKRTHAKHHQNQSGHDTTPPTFAGLKSAFACTPGPQKVGQTTPYTLSWNPASDDVTPTAKIVYDVFYSTTSGGENFSQPTWTTPPGATTFKTPGLPSHGSAYFVVRARDQAGNEDHNLVERRGVDPCV